MDPGSIVEDTKWTRFHSQTDKQMDGWTDGRTDRRTDHVKPVYHLSTLLKQAVKMTHIVSIFMQNFMQTVWSFWKLSPTYQTIRHNQESLYGPVLHDILYSTAETQALPKSHFVLTKCTPYLILTGKLWGVHYEDFQENLLHYKGTEQYFANTSLTEPTLTEVHWWRSPGPLFTKRTDGLGEDLVKSQSHKIQV